MKLGDARLMISAVLSTSVTTLACGGSTPEAHAADRLAAALAAVAHTPSVLASQNGAPQSPSTPPGGTASAAAPEAGSSPPSPTAEVGSATASGAAPAPGEVQPFAVEKFGAQNSLRLAFEGDWICDWSGDNQAQGRVGLQWFFFENVELDMFGTLNYVSQTGANAFGGGFDLQLRWHFLAMDTWSLFGEIGGGILATTADVPFDGSSFNFTPNVGFGATFALDESTRLYVGARWFHISNAALYANNPGRENTSIWVGLSFKL